MGGKTQRNSYKIRNKQAWLLCPSLFTTVLEILTREIRKLKEIREIQIGKKED